MVRPLSMNPTLPEVPPGSQRESASRSSPGEAVQMSFDPVRLDTMLKDQKQLHALFCAMVARFGGVDALQTALNRKPSYVSKISEAMSGGDGRALQVSWFAPMLRDPRCAELLLSTLSDICGYEPPVRRRELEREQIAEAGLRVIARSGAIGDAIREAIAKELGVAPDQVVW